ncbi:asparaginase [Sandarakinorhabdus limnophila]|uniref:asparaginase n=1 Tax=Sandarakinorhabdus limnophila TaxID=210512 RepID=UPI0026F30269|nr:asparaginase [Sandarakinorhabdus limnophila]
MGEGQALHKSTWILAAAMLLAGTTLHAQPVEPTATSQVRILATGGTIAGKGNAAGTSYRSGAVSVDDLIAALPGVDKIARVTGEQIANVASGDMDETIWRKLHARALAAFADPDVAGVVVTHGTDTLEETAFLLSLILPPTKPVVVVGAMRPSTAVSADGPQNMLDAIRVVTSPASTGRGVMVVLNNTIFDPRSVTKFDVNRVEAFTAPSRGPIGHVLGLAPRYFGPPQPQPEMLALGEAKLPRIAVVYAYAGQTDDEVRDIVRNADGVIVAGVGAGGVSSGARKALRALAEKKIPMVTTPRQGHGDIRRSEPTPAANSDDDDRVPTIGGRELTPAKARILLMLALQQRRTFAELQAIFDRAGTTN